MESFYYTSAQYMYMKLNKVVKTDNLEGMYHQKLGVSQGAPLSPSLLKQINTFLYL